MTAPIIGYRIRAMYGSTPYYHTGHDGCPRTACREGARLYKTRQSAHLAYWTKAPPGIACGDSFWVRAKVVRVIRKGGR